MSETDGEAVDAVGPWTIKAVATETRNAVTQAARQEGLTVGQWLEKRVAEWLADGSPVRVANVPAIVANGRQAPQAPPLDVQALTSAAVALRGVDALEPSTVTALNRLIRRAAQRS